MNIKKIFKSFDFRNNKIINAKTNVPTENEHIVPKSYVDINTTFDTPKSQHFTTPTNFNWLSNLYNKSYKDIFDELFFPVKNPIYSNPVITSMFINVLNEYTIIGNKKGIFSNEIKQFRIDYKINPGDRISLLTPKVIITNSLFNVTEYNGLSTSDTEGYIEFPITFKDLISIEFSKEFQEATEIKQNNYGDDFIPVEFQQNYTLTYDLLYLINKNYVIYPPLLLTKINGYDPVDFIDYLENGLDLNDTNNNDYHVCNYLKTRKLTINTFNVINDNIYIIGIPEPLYNTAEIKLHLNENISTFKPEMLKKNVIDLGYPENFNNIFECVYYDNTINYYFGLINLGNMSKQTNIFFQFNIYKTNTSF